MNYWILTTEYPHYTSGGIGTYCYHTAKMFSLEGYNVTVFIADFNLTKDENIFLNGHRVIRFCARKPEYKKFLGYSAYLSFEFAQVVREYCEKENIPYILEAQEYNGIAYYLQQFKLLKYPIYKELKILITCHAPSFICLQYDQAPRYQFPRYWSGEMEIASIKSADIVISPSDYLIKEIGKSYNINDTKINILVNPYEEEKEITINRENKAQDNIICFGKLAPLKGSFEILKKFKQLWDNGFNKPLTMIGGGGLFFYPENNTMQNIIHSNYKTYIDKGLLQLKGEIKKEKIFPFLKEAGVVILPSLFDNLPYAVIESLYHGSLVLTSMQGGQKELIRDKINGILFDHYTTNSFEDNLNYALEMDSAQKKQLKSEATASIKNNLNYKTVFAQKIEIIDNASHARENKKNYPFISGTTPLPDMKSNNTNQWVNGLLSVIIPFYNMGQFVEKTVASIRESSYSPIEIIIVNDGSTQIPDVEMITNLAGLHNITIIHQDNFGLAAARNAGAYAAKGEFLSFLDPDDYVEKEYYTKAITVLKSYDNVKYVGSWVQYFGSTNNCWPAFNPEFPYLLLHNMINSSALVYEKKAFLNHGLNDTAFIYGMEDWESVLSMTIASQRGVVLPELLFNYRVRPNSMSRKFNEEKRLFLYNLITKKHKKTYELYASEIVNILNANGPAYNYDNPCIEQKTDYNSVIKKIMGPKAIEAIKKSKTLSNIFASIYQKIKK